MRSEVAVQAGRLHERLAADVALELLDAQVDALVVVEVRGPAEDLAAHVALEHLARLVRGHVAHVLDLLVERLVAQLAPEVFVRFQVGLVAGHRAHAAAALARERLLARVLSPVHLQVVRLPETLAARLAAVRPLARMHPRVPLETGQRAKLLAAQFTLQVHVARVNLLVLLDEENCEYCWELISF